MKLILRNSIIILILWAFWTFTQQFLETDIQFNDKIYDRLHNNTVLTQMHDILFENDKLSDFCMMITTFMLDINLIYYIYTFFKYDEKKPILMLMAGVFLRQICQYVNRLPSPSDVIWNDPGFPTIIMNYNVLNDFFFSGHTLCSLVFGMELIKLKSKLVKSFALFFMISEISFVLVTRAHYFMDIYGAVTTYFMLTYFFDLLDLK
jgi:hypothetical protein